MKVGIYCRVSSEEQQERGTIENQIEFATKYCDLHNLDIVEWYKDDGITGTIPLEIRPAGVRILDDAKANRFDLLLIYRLDRLGRSARIILNAVYELEQYGVKIRSMTEPFDTGDPNGRFLLTILAGVADLERETILERMWYGANRAARAGKWLGGIVPYGYHLAEGYLEISRDPLPGTDLSEADVVSLIFRLIVENKYSTIRIADYLNALRIPTSYTKDNRLVKQGKRKVKTAGVWRPGRIRSIIVNTTYKGLHLYGKRSQKNRELISREVPAIVSEDIWEKAQLVLRENQLEAFKNCKQQYLLRGKIVCGKCGLTYHGVSYNGPQRKPKAYYVCGGKTAYRGPLQGKCTSKNVPKEWIEDLVWKTCTGFINNPGEALDELAANMEEKKSHNANLKTEIEMVSKAAGEMEVEKQSILDLYRKRIINAHDVELQLQKIDRERTAIENRIMELNRQIESKDNLVERYDTVEKLLTDMRSMIQESPPFEVKRKIVKTLVKEIVVDTEISEYGRPHAIVTVKYTFVKDVVGTRALAVITATNLKIAAALRWRSKDI